MESNNYVEKIRKFNRYYANVLGKIDQEIYNRPFPLTEARVITEINYRNGCTATEVRENLGIDRGYMSRIVQRFEDENIIIKKQSTEDKRQYSLYLTEYGENIYNDLVENANRGVDKMIDHLSKGDLSKLVTSMERIESIYSEERSSHSEALIRPFQPGDVGYVAYLHGNLYDKTYKFGQMFEYYVMKGLTEFLIDTDGGELWIAEVNGEIVGSIAITKFSDTVAQLKWFILNENYQGMGIGKKLMETALNFSKEQNYQHVFLWTVSTLETARHLYKKYNFRLTEEKTNDEWTTAKLIEERWDLILYEENQTK
ncbi:MULTISPECIES: bifunctional helix-turn-helix transcriptional regulator/GNAT family N-acetyltransferase [Peribacillus]|uniref:bifunctional helix-turn-helix transcriptional regulator/GNAT family N-acetyltransferase n=1 Tax=Peribacillus TaxID=2675229 RepID=UPI001F4E54AB|nr:MULTISPECIES: helix-turn-helix domain-containing GNAT family N-acetyltransferase [unclassified Peribacillus]MCK1985764.1 helix-turn-helix domain-containing GNAT family N-acetyltransferase [Peribacillus sp. Aquil_B1]MCK2010690.1 helix-turn-helix domain-containing GNAT family N-acetyltransferase [Peribacillus sp. Aquil_B8]